ncbi:MAG: tRNA lysidine(34) synthetase TilS [Spirochaetaceae bacterium]|nr:MAG: tRNA lysidine(34) synthetase TilS [Spirochaetaceae bacterium]
MNTTGVEQELRKTILHVIERNRLDPSAHWIIACSGGRDSSVLATVFSPLVAGCGGTASVAYVDHGLRCETERRAERNSVERIARQLAVPIDCTVIEPGVIRSTAQSSGRSIEDVARQVRYRALGEHAKAREGAYIVTGHHLHDQLETVLMRLTRGSGARGLAGIPEVRLLNAGRRFEERQPLLVRPFLSVDPALLEEFARQWSAARGEVLYIEDSTNRSHAFRRNRFRAGVTPGLLDVEPAAAHGVAVSAERMRETDEALRFAAGEALSLRSDATASPEVVIDAVRFAAFPLALRRSCCFLAVDRLLGFDSAAGISHHFFRPLIEWDGTSDVLLRGHGLRVLFSADVADGTIVVHRDVVRNEKKGYLVSTGEGSQRAGLGCMVVGVRSGDRRWSVRVKVSSCSPPLVVRSRRPGDRVAQRYGHKRLKKLCTERGSEVLVLEDRAGIVAAFFSPWGGDDLFRPDALRLEQDESPGDGTGPTTHTEIVWQGDTGFELATE